MTKEEFNLRYNEIQKECEERVKALRREYVRENARFKKGDKIKFKNTAIIVERVYGSCFSSTIPTLYYCGTSLTKAGVPRKDGQTNSIFEQDGIEYFRP